MANSGIMTIFGEPEKAGFYPSSFVVSVLLHAGFFSLLTARLIQTHHIIERFPTDRFAVRYVNFHSTEPQTRPAAGGGIHYSGPIQPVQDQSAAAKVQPGPQAPPSAGGSPAAPAIARITVKRMPASQTLIQPDIPPTVTISEKTTVPLVVLWTTDKTTVKTVAPALPKTASIAVAQPSLETPIKEENIADLKLSSSAFVTQGPAVPPSTTTPVVVHGPEELKKVPQTTSKQPEPPSPARIVSLSDVRVADGKVTVPMANQTAKADPGALIPGQLKDAAPSGNGASPAKSPGNGTGKAAGDHAGNKADAATNPGNSSAGAGNQTAKAAQGSSAQPATDHAAKAGPATQAVAKAVAPGPSTAQPTPQTGAASGATQGAALGSGVGSQSGTVRISLPKDGQFGVVVFGSSVADQYPETAEMWSGRMASTVYLHVGLPKSWILQYALPRLAAASGEGHIDAPWPYEIARPTLDPGDVNADAVILHGFVDKDGHFEKLEVVFPEQLTQAPTWVKALSQWQFRPAKQNGQPIPIEVLLIIPDQAE